MQNLCTGGCRWLHPRFMRLDLRDPRLRLALELSGQPRPLAAANELVGLGAEAQPGRSQRQPAEFALVHVVGFVLRSSTTISRC